MKFLLIPLLIILIWVAIRLFFWGATHLMKLLNKLYGE